MQVGFYLLLVVHVTEGCTLENSRISSYVTAHTGGSVLLPCYCTDLYAKPETFTWQKYHTNTNTWEVISSESGQYRNKVQLVNGHSPGNLSLLISHLTEEDGEWYRCDLNEDEYRGIKLTVEGPTSPPNRHDFLIYGAVGGLLMLLVLGGVIYWRYRAQRREQMDSCESKAGQRRDQETQDCPEVLYCTVPSEPADKAEQKQDDVTYSTIDHGNASTPTHKLMDAGDTIEYASIKLN
ncbi:uncharacterized protein LOC118815316 isoform X2 [Colossoma macropomum]|uniref:uncharacterized protein LOC118815316 isoform X2 n=1 Tax=Colossoma macropomum TaxID=42526 RepID=UPI0018653889|nr:uncharacterized protein LOC118815316 isoform X2 [Colossoma macropomum]